MTRKLHDIGLIGLAVMGQNLVLNMARHGYSVAVYNRTASRMESFVKERAGGLPVEGYRELASFVESLARPRKIMLMVKAGPAVDAVIDSLLPLVDEGDVIIDGGNSYYRDTIRRMKDLESRGLRFIGTGVSGGEEGALKGPSIMPGGSPEAWPLVRGIFRDIAAKVADGTPCCDWVGSGGAGHFVKMCHNGIEYGDMQLIAETYDILRTAAGLSADEIGGIFREWNRGELSSYLVGITADILTVDDPETGRPLVESILDVAGQKGTGSWTGREALDLGVPVPTITGAVFARTLSAQYDERRAARGCLSGGGLSGLPESLGRDDLGVLLGKALYAAKICSYAQGFNLMRAASHHHGWGLDYGAVALMWRAGCIIRAQFLDRIKEAFDAHPDAPHLLLTPYFADILSRSNDALRTVVSLAVRAGIPAPALSSAIAYYDGFRSDSLPMNLVQAQRDYFGAHTYERRDRPRGVFFHTEWPDSDGS